MPIIDYSLKIVYIFNINRLFMLHGDRIGSQNGRELVIAAIVDNSY
jgi:hypothetical protein